jgi:actin-like ATPase involved in cell morphogenesis
VIVLPADDGGLQVVRTLTCLASYENPITGETKYAFGDDAAAEYPEKVQFPLRSGLPAAGEQTDRARQFFDAVVDSHDIPAHSVVVYATPASGDESGQTNLRSVIEESRIGEAGIERYPEGLCGSIPAFGDGLEAIDEVFLAVNLGSASTEFAAYRRGEQLAPYRTGSVTGNEVDRDIVNNVENESGSRVHIDINTAREYKEQYADFENFEPVTETIQQPGGGRHEFTVSWSIMDPVEAYLDGVVSEFTEQFLPQLANDYRRVYRPAIQKPVVLTGGMACVPGLVDAFERRVADRLDEEVTAVAPNRADLAATVGAYRIADRLRQ